ncbi:MAG: HAD-IA family hydrolase [Rhodocyclaceae bacterium]|nr:HAD-IA family hydrolase [Rhodocyclaceae bacterium]
MARRYELIVFDWDGTLLDSAGAIAACIQAAARELGVPEPSDEAARHVIGLGLSDALARAMPELPSERYPQAVDRYRHHFLSQDQDLSLFPGAFSLVEALHGLDLLLAVATGKSRLGLSRALDTSGLKSYFHATRCADETHSKPHPAMLEEIMAELGMTPEQTLMVGDTTHDLLMAKNAGVDAVGVSFGAHPKEALLGEKPVACFDRFADLNDWLLKCVRREA